MFIEGITEVARERAATMRDVEYIRESVEDSFLQENMLVMESCEDGPCSESKLITPEEHDELVDAIERLQVDPEEANTEIDRIVTCDKPTIDLSEVMGLPESNRDAIADECGDVTTW